MDLGRFNQLPREEAIMCLKTCCGSQSWAETIAHRRPFDDLDTVLRSASEVWFQLGKADWLEAFASHPKIGEKKAQAQQSEQEQRWSEQEQSGASLATEGAIGRLAQLNREYEERFGFIFIVCATGKTVEEMLELLSSRIGNDPALELRIAAGEQAKITELRLRKLFAA
jgi:OHCU decarboxylase